MRDDFCAFILTHGRPDKVLTYRTLRRAGYGGMSPDEFYTDKGEWLTLKQLRERDAQVFRKAGI